LLFGRPSPPPCQLLESFKKSRRRFAIGHSSFDIGGEAVYILAHRHRAGKFFPIATSPKLAPASIIVSD
jgi:hypothetical protein